MSRSEPTKREAALFLALQRSEASRIALAAEMAAEIARPRNTGDKTWFYCTGCRMDVHRREVEYESHSPIPYHRTCGADVEIRND